MEEQMDILNTAAMKIIMDAGDARDLISKSLDAMGDNCFADAETLLSQAQLKIKSAHGHQTDIIQKEAEGVSYTNSLLFSHAQDTLMTIGSEYNIARKCIGILKNINNRFSQLEGRL